jgi:hypothetical protein
MPKFKVEVEIVMVQDREIRMHSVTFVDSVEEAFQTAMGEYRKFVSENIQKKK